MNTTNHSLQMAHKRLGLNERAARCNITLAYERGRHMDAFCGKDFRYLLGKCEAGCEPVVYQSAIYIFSPDGTCVTLYPLPRWFGEPRHYDGKRKVRDAYRWMKRMEVEMSLAGELA